MNLDVFGRPPAVWELEVLRARRVIQVPAERDPRVLRDFTVGLIRGILSGDREPRPYDPTFCSRCPAKEYCPRWSRPPRALPTASEGRPENQLLLF